MSTVANPALAEFIAFLGTELAFAEVMVRRQGDGFELRHIADSSTATTSLRTLKPADARTLAQLTAAGEFRPLKSAPNLPRGWLLVASTDADLELALNGLYPGALADWFAARSPNPPATHYREYTARQSGMYRLTTKLTDTQVSEVIGGTCGATRCLKRRLWTVTGTEPDTADAKSLIPCLEPCAVLLEAARQAARDAQKND